MKSLIVGLVREESGTTAIEYALIASGIFLAIVVSVGQVGSEVIVLFDSVAAAF